MIDLATQFNGAVDEKFSTESKHELFTNNLYDWTGAKTVKIYKISTGKMQDYDRNGQKKEQKSRYGDVEDLTAITEEMTLKKDRSFTYCIDLMDSDETKAALEASTSLERQLREVVIPEIDNYVINEIAKKAGTTKTLEINSTNIYDEIIEASVVLDENEVPEQGRVIIVTPETFKTLKKCTDIKLNTLLGDELVRRGVIATLDGNIIVKVPPNRLPEHTNFIVCHPVATVAVKKLYDYKIHHKPPFISGDLIEGRFVYDAFVLDNKVKAIYLHKAQ